MVIFLFTILFDAYSTYCTLLLKEAFNPKAVSKLMGHTKELIAMDVYTDNRGIIAGGVPEIEAYMKEVLPDLEEMDSFKKQLLEIVIDVTEFLPNKCEKQKRTKVRFCTYTNLVICGKIKKFFQCCFAHME